MGEVPRLQVVTISCVSARGGAEDMVRTMGDGSVRWCVFIHRLMQVPSLKLKGKNFLICEQQ